MPKEPRRATIEATMQKKHSFTPFFFFFFLSFLLAGCTQDDAVSELCFIGDSITHQWDVESFFPGYIIHKHAVNGAKLRDIQKWDISDCKGRWTIMLMGTNDIGHIGINQENAQDTIQSFAHAYVQQAQVLQAEFLLAISILPRHYKGENEIDHNKLIEKQNQLLADSLKITNLRFKFVDAYSLFLSQDYTINEDLFRDGLHPRPEGYEILSNAIRREL